MFKRTHKKPVSVTELDVTSFMNLMVVLIPFLLATAVFSQVAIQELNLPSPGAGGNIADTPPPVMVEVMVRKEALELGDGKVINYTFPRLDDGYDLDALAQQLRSIKAENPDKEDITVLLEPEIRYSDMIAVMDAVKIYRQRDSDGSDVSEILFPDIAIGDAP